MQRSINKTLTVGRQWGFSSPHVTSPLNHHNKGLNECLVKGQSSWTRTENFPHQCTERRTGRLLLKISPIADKESRRWTNVSHAVSKFILSNRGWSSVDRGTPRENEGGTGKKWGQEGVTAGHIRLQESCCCCFFLNYFSSFEKKEGVCSIRWARQATEKQSEVLKLSKGENKNREAKENRGGGEGGAQ